MAAAYHFSVNEFLSQIPGRPLDDIISEMHRSLNSVMESWDLTVQDKIRFFQVLHVLEQVAFVRDGQQPLHYAQPPRLWWCQCLSGNCCCYRCFSATGENRFLGVGKNAAPVCEISN